MTNRIFKTLINTIVMLLLVTGSAISANRVDIAAFYVANPSTSRALANAQIYVGIVDLDPEILANQKQVSALQENGVAIPIPQPISTSKGGVPQYNGSSVSLLVDGSYSIKVLDSYGSQVYYIPNTDAYVNNEDFESGLQTKVTKIDTIADLRTHTGYTGESAQVLGYYTPGDGGGGYLRIWKTGGSYTDNGGSVITPGGIPSPDAWVFAIDGPVDPRSFGANSEGLTDAHGPIVAADTYSASIGQSIIFNNGTYLINSDISFSSIVTMAGGVLTGAGTVSFPEAFSSPVYHCFDILVAQIKSETVYAEWFGAKQSTDLAPTIGKAWNVWPSFITGAGFGVDQNYGDANFLATNTPFSDNDTYDFVAIQRALWSLGVVTNPYRGKIDLLGGRYYLTRAVRYVGNMASNIYGAGRTKTILTYKDINTHEVQGFDAGNAKCLLTFYASGPDPTYIDGVSLSGPSGYGFDQTPKVVPAVLQQANGINFNNMWFTTGDELVRLERNSSDAWMTSCMFEFGVIGVNGADSGSWWQMADCAVWGSPGIVQTGVKAGGYAFLTGMTFVSMHEPFDLGLGSHVSSTTIIQEGTGYRNTVNGRTITRRLDVPAGATVDILTVEMADSDSNTSEITFGGRVAGIGSAGLYRKLSWNTDQASPVAGVLEATTKFGFAGALPLIDDGISLGARTYTLQVKNIGTTGQDYSCDVTVKLAGGDAIVTGIR